jgi:glyoxylase-like metal-dependent hydrolase (beta-lactamase superfamily II)
MKKILLSLLIAIIVVGVGLTLYLRQDLQQFEVTTLTPDLHMISGDYGGNVAVLRTGAGTVVVDTMTFVLQGEAIRETAESLTGEPVVMVINTHYHLDHSHGNPAFGNGTRVVASERTRHHLDQLDADFFSGEAASTLPQELVSDQGEIRVGEKTLRLLVPGRGHTDGDLVVLFVEDRAIHMGDLYFNRRYPNIDLEAGGSVVAWGDTLDTIFGLPFDQVIPGHGPASDADGLRQFQAFIRELAEVGAYAASINGSLEDTLVNGRLTEDAGYEPIKFGPLPALDREFVIRRAWEEATGAFELYEGY